MHFFFFSWERLGPLWRWDRIVTPILPMVACIRWHFIDVGGIEVSTWHWPDSVSSSGSHPSDFLQKAKKRAKIRLGTEQELLTEEQRHELEPQLANQENKVSVFLPQASHFHLPKVDLRTEMFHSFLRVLRASVPRYCRMRLDVWNRVQEQAWRGCGFTSLGPCPALAWRRVVRAMPPSS